MSVFLFLNPHEGVEKVYKALYVPVLDEPTHIRVFPIRGFVIVFSLFGFATGLKYIYNITWNNVKTQ